MIPTKLKFTDWEFDVDTPGFFKEASENCIGGIYPICWKMLTNLMTKVAIRATELNDPVMNLLMVKLGLYEYDKTNKAELVEQLLKIINNQ